MTDQPSEGPSQQTGEPADFTRVRRLPELQSTDVADLHDVLDSALVAHVGLVMDGRPFVLPMAYARDGDRVLLHGSTGSRLFLALRDGAEVCFSVTVLDGLVLARSAFESSMGYRSAMVFGSCVPVEGEARLRAFERLTERLLPGRWADVRQPNAKELAATAMLELPLSSWSVKISSDDPADSPEDLHTDYWAGTVPLLRMWGEPVPAEDLKAGVPIPDYIAKWRHGGA